MNEYIGIKPLGARVVIKLQGSNFEKTEGGLILCKEKPQEAEVPAVGPGTGGREDESKGWR